MHVRHKLILTFALALTCLLVGCESKKISSAAASPAVQEHVVATRPTTAPALPPTRRSHEPLTVAQRTAADGVEVATLSNGLTVIVKATRTAQVVCVRAYVRAGGLYEGKWLGCGISHLTEHLVAKGAVHDMGPGATAAEAKQTSDRVADIGGQSNAYTSLAHTCYYISASAGRTMDCIDLMADWLARPEITAEDFGREHGVVQRELEMGKDNPARQLWYANAANIFGTHPAAVPVIGYADPLSRLSRQDVRAYHKRMYVPQNMVFCVVGDVDTAAVLERARRAFAGFGHGRAPALSLSEVRPVAATRRVVREHKSLKDAMANISFQTIPLMHEDLYALDVLSYVLTHGEASRLYRIVQREKKLVTRISSSSWTPQWGRGVFSFSFRSEPPKADAAEEALVAELKTVVSDGVSPRELARAKRQKIADHVRGQQTAESVAATLATDYLTTGDVHFSRHYTDRIQAVTGEQVHQVARKYFDFDRMIVTCLVPKSSEAAADTGAKAAAPREEGLFTLPNGLRVVLSPTDSVGLVSMAFVSRGGLLLETDRTNGMGAAMTVLSTKGAGGRSADEIAALFDEAGGAISGNCGYNTFYWRATALDDRFEKALEVLADVILRPEFSAKELEIIRPVLLARIKQQDDRWQSQLQRFFRKKFFVDSPYQMLPIGAADVIGPVTAEQLAEFHRGNVRAGSAVLTIYGNFDASAARKRVTELFADLQAGEVEIPAALTRKVSEDGEQHVLPTDNRVGAVIVAAAGMKLDNLEDRLPMDVLDTIISGYHLPSGWMHTELRGKQLVYVVHSYNLVGLAPGAFVTYAACQPGKVPTVVDIIKRNLERAANYTPTQKEIDLAVNTILTAERLQKQSMPELAMSAALDELYGFGYDFSRKVEARYRKITPQDVLRVARKYLGGGYVVVVTTPEPEALDGPAPDGTK